MRERSIFFSLVVASVSVVLLAGYVYSCNEMVCASIVSKCMLTQSCKCDMKNCTCCKECAQCLSHLYAECCSCLEMCPKPNDTKNELSKKSHIEDLEGVPGLFNALTGDSDGSDSFGGYRIFTFPVDFDSALFGNKMDKNVKFIMHSADQDLDEKLKQRENIITMNCTVAYFTQCVSWNKCKQTCISMGASSYRWFHDGCCECVGDTCINYGINDSRCLACPEPKDGVQLDFDEDIPLEELEYGESMMDLEKY